MDTPEIEEYITGDEWTLTCKDPTCNWTTYGEKTEYFIEELGEAMNRHKEWHRSRRVENE